MANHDESVEAIPPGERLRDMLAERGWIQEDLSFILGREVGLVTDIVTGRRKISPDIASILAPAMGTTAKYWMDLERDYQLSKLRANPDDPIARRAFLYELAPINEMVKRGWIKGSKDIQELEEQVVRFFGCTTVAEIGNPPAHSARKSTSYASGLTPGQRAWLRRAIQLGRTAMAADFVPENVMQAVKEMRPLMADPSKAGILPMILAQHGIRFVVVQPLANTRIDGACIWLDGHPIVALSIRFDRFDSFLYTLLHECGHCHAPYESLDMDTASPEDQTSHKIAEEIEADLFARRNIIRPSAIRKFIESKSPIYSAADIAAFAKTQNIHPSIVVGQLQRRSEVPYSHFRSMLVPIRAHVTASAPTDGWGVSAPAI